MRELGETPGTTLQIRLPGEVYTQVCGMSSPLRSFREPVHLSAFLFASFPNAYESTIDLMMFNLILCSIFRDKSFSQTKRESEICNATAILEVSGKLNLLMNLNRVPLIVLGFTIFIFPLIS